MWQIFVSVLIASDVLKPELGLLDLALISFKSSNICGSCPRKHEGIKTDCVWVRVLEGEGQLSVVFSPT